MSRGFRRLPRIENCAQLALAMVLSWPLALLADDAPSNCAALVVEVFRGDEAGKAGVRAGDCVEGWRMAGEEGFAPLDAVELRRIELEQAPTGKVELSLRREADEHRVTMPTGHWGLRVLPAMQAESRKRWTEWIRAPEHPPPWNPDGQSASEAVALLILESAVFQGLSPNRGADLFKEQRLALDRASLPASGAAILAFEHCLLLSAALRLEEAAARCGDAVASYGALGRKIGSLQAARLVADVARLYGKMEEAERLYSAALRDAQASVPDSLLVAMLHFGLGLTLRYQDRFDEALNQLDQGMTLLERLDAAERLRMRFENAKGLVYRGEGKIDEALVVFKRASALAAQVAPDSLELSRFLNNLALAHWDRGEFRRSLEVFSEVRRLVERFGGSPVERGMVLQNMASVALPLGRSRDAETYASRSLEILGSEHAPKVEAEARILLGRSYASQGRIEDALREYGLAQSKLAEVSTGSVTSWPAYFKARLLLEAGRSKEAAPEAEAFLALQRKAGAASRELGFAVQLQGEVLASGKHNPEAVAAFEEAVRLRREHAPRTLRLAQSLHSLGLARSAMADADGARDALCEAVDVLESQRGTWGQTRDDLLELGVQSAEIYSDCAAAKLDDGRAEAAFDVLESGRARALRELLAPYRDLLSANGRGAEAGPDPGGHAPTAASETWARLRAALPADVAVIGYLSSRGRSWIVVGNAALATPRFHPLGLPDAEFRRRVAEFTSLAGDPRSDPARLRTLGRKLYQDVLHEAIDGFPQIGRLLILSDAMLSTLPFPALVDASGEYLVERYEIQHSQSLTLAMAKGAQSRGRTSPPPRFSLLAFADPAIDPAQARRWSVPAFPRLPGAMHEAELAAARYGSDTLVLAGENATEGALRRTLANARQVHLATHGVMDREHPFESALLLGAGGGGENDDGVFRALDFFSFDLSNVDVVNVAACSLGGGTALQGEGLLGFRYALRAAGAKRVIASLWDVSDRSGEIAMTSYYEKVARGDRPSEALRWAQAAVRSSEGGLSRPTRGVGGVTPARTPRQHAHPFYWAGYVIDGVLSPATSPDSE